MNWPYVAEASFFITMHICRNGSPMAPITGMALKHPKYPLTKMYPQLVLYRMCPTHTQIPKYEDQVNLLAPAKSPNHHSSEMYLHTAVSMYL